MEVRLGRLDDRRIFFIRRAATPPFYPPTIGPRVYRGAVLEHFVEGGQAKRMEKMVLGCHPFRAWISRGHLVLKITPFQG